MDINATNCGESGFISPGIWGPSAGVGWLTDLPNNWLAGSVVQTLVTPGDYEVTWSFLDNTGWDLSLTGLNAAFPGGYVVGVIGGNKSSLTSEIDITEDAGSTLVDAVTFTVLPDNMGVGGSVALTDDAITRA